MTGEFVTAGHLGGYVAGGDPATVYPDLWQWLVHSRGVRSVVDVGCGDGVALRAFEALGCDVLGIDGVEQDDPRIVTWDYVDGPFVPIAAEPVDLVWSCEFVEHVEERYVGNFLATFQVGQMVLMTHAEPGQPGWHHVNCQPADYWIARLDEAGFDLDRPLTDAARLMAAANEHPANHFVRSGLAFRRREG